MKVYKIKRNNLFEKGAKFVYNGFKDYWGIDKFSVNGTKGVYVSDEFNTIGFLSIINSRPLPSEFYFKNVLDKNYTICELSALHLEPTLKLKKKKDLLTLLIYYGFTLYDPEMYIATFKPGVAKFLSYLGLNFFVVSELYNITPNNKYWTNFPLPKLYGTLGIEVQRWMHDQILPKHTLYDLL